MHSLEKERKTTQTFDFIKFWLLLSEIYLIYFLNRKILVLSFH